MTTQVVVTATAGWEPAVTVVSPGPTGRGHLGVRRLPTRDGVARLALVAEGALLLQGDDVGVELVVGSGARVEVVEPSGTVAYPMRGGRARWHVDVDVAEGASVHWRGLPFVVAEGADVERSTRVRLAAGAVAVLREVLVLGRTGEPGGAVDSRLRVEGPDEALLAEDLLLGPGLPRVGVTGDARVVDTVTVLGRRAGTSPPDVTRLELEGDGTQLRWLGAATHASPLEGFAARAAWGDAVRARALGRRAADVSDLPAWAGPLGLRRHPEGGWYAETWCSDVDVPGAVTGVPGPRAAATAIHFLLLPGEESAWHRVRSAELWLLDRGALELSLGGDGDRPSSMRTDVLGPDLAAGERLQLLVPAGHWQAARPLRGEPCLVSCVVAPGFDYADFELAQEGEDLRETCRPDAPGAVLGEDLRET